MNRELKDSEDFIRNNTSGVHGFNAPKNYFKTIEDSVIANIAEQGFNKDTAFHTPDNYFENFEEKLFSKLGTPKKEVKVISLRSRLLKIIPTAAAASVLLFIGLNYFSNSVNNTFDSISSEELENWFDESYTEFNANTSIEFVDADFTEMNIIENESSVEDEDILEYFNTFDNTSLLTEMES